jgi:hypothetical protein
MHLVLMDFMTSSQAGHLDLSAMSNLVYSLVDSSLEKFILSVLVDNGFQEISLELQGDIDGTHQHILGNLDLFSGSQSL